MEPSSPANRLNLADVKKWMRNTFVFLAPLGAIYCVSVISAIKTDGFAWSDFALTTRVLGAISLYALNVLYDLFNKYRKDNNNPVTPLA